MVDPETRKNGKYVNYKNINIIVSIMNYNYFADDIHCTNNIVQLSVCVPVFQLKKKQHFFHPIYR